MLSVIFVTLTACNSTIDRLKRVGKPPEFSGLEIPHPDHTTAQADTVDRERIRATNSLWQPGSTTFFRDNRAWRVGDILRVNVKISDSAKLNNSTQQNRNTSSSSGISALFGQESRVAENVLHSSGLDPLTGESSKRRHVGSGNIARQETVQVEIAATVKQVLQNGNLVIGGHQEVRVNSELREVKIAGIIRPKDISADNAINSDQIAEARISYGGRGTVSDVQEPKPGSQILDIINPF